MTIKEKLEGLGYTDILTFEGFSYDTAFIGLSEDNRAIYDYELMIDFLVTNGMEIEEAIEWIDYSTIRTLSLMGENAPIILHSI